MSPVTASGAELFFKSTDVKFVDSSRIIIPLYMHLDTNECVNAAEVHLNIKGEGARIVGFEHNDAVFPMWLHGQAGNDPSFIMGATDEICGSSGDSNGVIASVIISAPNGGVIKFDDDTNIALSDGKGTVAQLKSHEFVIPIQRKLRKRFL